MNILATNLFAKLILYTPVLFDGDAADEAAGLLKQAYDKLLIIATPLAVLMIGVCAFKLFIASDPQSTRQAKTWLITIMIALALLYMAEPIVNMVKGAFSTGAATDIYFSFLL